MNRSAGLFGTEDERVGNHDHPAIRWLEHERANRQLHALRHEPRPDAVLDDEHLRHCTVELDGPFGG